MNLDNAQRASVLVEALPYIREYTGRIVEMCIRDRLKHDVIRRKEKHVTLHQIQYVKSADTPVGRLKRSMKHEACPPGSLLQLYHKMAQICLQIQKPIACAKKDVYN